MGVDDTLLNEIVRRVLGVAQPERIILFGSAAAGPMNRDSDIDLLVLEPAPQNTRGESVRIGDALRSLGSPLTSSWWLPRDSRRPRPHWRNSLSGKQNWESDL